MPLLAAPHAAALVVCANAPGAVIIAPMASASTITTPITYLRVIFFTIYDEITATPCKKR